MKHSLNCIVRLRIGRMDRDGRSAFGYGTACLLDGIARLHSLNQAAKEMGMAYSKAWKSIKATEENLGFALIQRKGPSGSVLTPRGEWFLSLYQDMEAAAQEGANAVLQRALSQKDPWDAPDEEHFA